MFVIMFMLEEKTYKEMIEWMMRELGFSNLSIITWRW